MSHDSLTGREVDRLGTARFPSRVLPAARAHRPLRRSEASLVMRLPCVVGVGVSPQEPEIGRRGLGGVEYLCHIARVGQVRSCPLLVGLDEVPQLEAAERNRVQREFYLREVYERLQTTTS